jgi:tight adherence protein C
MAFLLYTFLAIVAIAVSGYAYVIDYRRRGLLNRAFFDTGPAAAPRSALLTAPEPTFADRVRALLGRMVPSSWVSDGDLQARLIRAGREDEAAALHFVVLRIALLIVLPVFAVLFIGPESVSTWLLAFVTGVCCAWVAPGALLDGRIRRRQERIRKGIADALDLMLVCVEAGIGLDSAMLRVSREMVTVHPDIAFELATALRRAKAGVPREDALRGLFVRTGVDELRVFAANVLQSERWGTGIAKVLRLTAETLRRRRRQAAEKRAQTAALKMTIPLVVMILPPLFVAILGPTVMQVMLFVAILGPTVMQVMGSMHAR